MRQFVERLADGCTTTVYVVTYSRRTTRPRVVTLETAQSLRAWTRRTGVAEAIGVDCESADFAGGGHPARGAMPPADERHPRAALAATRDQYLAVVCDGNSLRDAGLTVPELDGLMARLGAQTVTHLAAGPAVSLVSGGVLHNRPRQPSGIALLGGGPLAGAIVFDR